MGIRFKALSKSERFKYTLDSAKKRGFTLIEMSIVLVIIGLIVGGILVGQSLIDAAGMRATISQIQKYNQATNTFYGKYGYLPGDIPNPTATSFGFASRGPEPGMGNGDGIIAGFYLPNSVTKGALQSGEPGMFWVDLSKAQLIGGTFSTATPTQLSSLCVVTPTSTPKLSDFFPQAKLGYNTYVVVWSGGYSLADGTNYFGLTAISQTYCYGTSQFIYPQNGSFVPVGLTVAQADGIDAKIDVGLPQSGNVMAITPGYGNAYWSGTTEEGAPYTTAIPGSSSTCFDNSTAASGTPGVAGAAQHYSLEISNGSNPNCTLSFRFQ